MLYFELKTCDNIQAVKLIFTAIIALFQQFILGTEPDRVKFSIFNSSFRNNFTSYWNQLDTFFHTLPPHFDFHNFIFFFQNENSLENSPQFFHGLASLLVLTIS